MIEILNSINTELLVTILARQDVSPALKEYDDKRTERDVQ